MPAVGGPCTTNQECVVRAAGQPAICRKDKKTCAPLLSADCQNVYGDFKSDDAIVLGSIRPGQHLTQPPRGFSEASLVKELEERGIGRPSTYASIMSTIVDRGYVDKK